VPVSEYLAVAGGERRPAQPRGCSLLHKMLMALGRHGGALPSPEHPVQEQGEPAGVLYFIILMPSEIF